MSPGSKQDIKIRTPRCWALAMVLWKPPQEFLLDQSRDSPTSPMFSDTIVTTILNIFIDSSMLCINPTPTAMILGRYFCHDLLSTEEDTKISQITKSSKRGKGHSHPSGLAPELCLQQLRDYLHVIDAVSWILRDNIRQRCQHRPKMASKIV